MVNAAESGGFCSTLTVVSERGTSVEIHHYVFDGAFHATEGSDPRELSFRRTDPTTIERQTRRNGRDHRHAAHSAIERRPHHDLRGVRDVRQWHEVRERYPRVREAMPDSVIVKNIGRALLARAGDPYAAEWEIDRTSRAARERHPRRYAARDCGVSAPSLAGASD